MLTSVSPSVSLGGQFERRPPKTAVRAVDDVQRKASKPELLPAGDQEFGALVVNIEMHRVEIVRSERAGVLHRSRGRQVDLVHKNDDDMPPQHLCLTGGDGGALFQDRVFLPVLPVRPHQGEDDDRHDDDDDPCPLVELGDGEDDDHDRAHHSGDGVDRDTFAPVLVAVTPVVGHHARASHGEPSEDADGVHRE